MINRQKKHHQQNRVRFTAPARLLEIPEISPRPDPPEVIAAMARLEANDRESKGVPADVTTDQFDFEAAVQAVFPGGK